MPPWRLFHFEVLKLDGRGTSMHELPGDSYESFDVCQVSPQKAKSNLLNVPLL